MTEDGHLQVQQLTRQAAAAGRSSGSSSSGLGGQVPAPPPGGDYLASSISSSSVTAEGMDVGLRMILSQLHRPKLLSDIQVGR